MPLIPVFSRQRQVDPCGFEDSQDYIARPSLRREGDRQTEKQTDRKTDRQTHTHRQENERKNHPVSKQTIVKTFLKPGLGGRLVGCSTNYRKV